MPLAKHLIAQVCKVNGQAIPELTAAGRSKITSYDWPGNVRELDNVIQRAIILHSDRIIDAGDLLIENFDSEIVTEIPIENTGEDKLGNEL